jgi:hypothetical protein
MDANWSDDSIRQQISDIGRTGADIVEVPQTRLAYSEGREMRKPGRPMAFTGTWAIRGDSLLWTESANRDFRLSDGGSVSTRSGRDHNKGARNGLIYGGAIGGMLGFAAGVAMMQECDPATWDIFCGISLGEALGGAAVTALVGGVAGALLGAVTGAQRTTVYRFRADTPQQLDVVVSLQPRLWQRSVGQATR